VIEHYREEDAVGATDDLGVSCRIFAGFNEWFLGYPDLALRYVEDALSRARRLNNQAAVAFVLSTGSHVHELRRDFKRALEDAEQALKLGTQLGFPLHNTLSRLRCAYARSRTGETAGTVQEIQNGLVELNAMNFYLARQAFMSYLAEGQALTGSVADALATVEQALQANPEELLYRPEVFRLRGELKLESDAEGKAQIEPAQHDFRTAIELSLAMGAKSYELRATTSLARLLANQGHRDEARAMLAEIYGWFTEGFDTADLKDAKALLNELGT
jgi:tetratricopeptide (TPR) repeat protein